GQRARSLYAPARPCPALPDQPRRRCHRLAAGHGRIDHLDAAGDRGFRSRRKTSGARHDHGRRQITRTTKGNILTRIASHRGGTLEFGDSTPAGFIATSRMDLEEVEFDVHPTRDGHIVVHHDPTLDRTTDSTGAIAELPLTDVLAAAIRDGEGGHPLRLEQ